MNRNSRPPKIVGRKKRVAVWNRRLAWLTFVTLTIGTLFYYGPPGDWWPRLGKIGAILVNGLFTPLFFIHAIFSVYLFGFPKFKRNLRICHLYIGYTVFFCTLVSQALIGFEPYHKLFFGMNWLFIFLHVALGTRFMMQRRGNTQRHQELAYYTGGSIFRDATKN